MKVLNILIQEYNGQLAVNVINDQSQSALESETELANAIAEVIKEYLKIE